MPIEGHSYNNNFQKDYNCKMGILINTSSSIYCILLPIQMKGCFEIESVHEIFNNVLCATSKASDQPAHMRSLIRAFAIRLSIL